MSNTAEQHREHRLPVSAVILTHNRKRSLRIMPERLSGRGQRGLPDAPQT
jgi:hypothetical protein